MERYQGISQSLLIPLNPLNANLDLSPCPDNLTELIFYSPLRLLCPINLSLLSDRRPPSEEGILLSTEFNFYKVEHNIWPHPYF